MVKHKVSRVQNRKPAIQVAIAAREPIKPRKQKTNCSKKKDETTTTIYDYDQTPLDVRKEICQWRVGGGKTQYILIESTVKMVVVLHKYSEERLSE